MQQHSTASLVDSLLRPEAYPHPVEQVELRETHISYVLLTGSIAYKIKKPVILDFLDFSTLERRRLDCEQELRLNQMFAPQLYLAVVPITGNVSNPRVAGTGEVIEYAVSMRQFDEHGLLSQMIARGDLLPQHVDQLAAEVGRCHLAADHASETSAFGSVPLILQEARDNLRELERVDPTIWRDPERILELQDWTGQTARRLEVEFLRRRQQGQIRECHGDLHLGNLVLFEGRITLFDRIEFNDAFRWIDVVSDAAFVVMDLADRGRADLSQRFLNAYLETTGDYTGLRVFQWYLVYRSLVRAKVAVIRARQTGVLRNERKRLYRQAEEYVQLAVHYTCSVRQAVIITHGLSGSGKTTGTQLLLEAIGAIRIRSDVERKRLFGLNALARSGAGIDQDLYSPEATQRTFARLEELAREIVQTGRPAIVDATFLRHAQRQQFQNLAEELDVPFFIVPFDADEHTLRERLNLRSTTRSDPSDADVTVLEHQLRTREPLTMDERARCRTVNQLQEDWRRTGAP